MHLVAHDLAPERAVFIGLHHCHCFVIIEDHRLLFVLDLRSIRIPSPDVDDGKLPTLKLIFSDDKSERRKSRGIVLEYHAVVDAKHSTASHVPPANGVLVRGIGDRYVTTRRLDVAAILLLRSVGREPGVMVVVVRRMGEDNGLVVVICEGDSGVETLRTVDPMVHGTDLEALLGASHQTGLATAVSRASSSDDSSLHEDTRAAVVSLGKGDGVLVVLPEVEVAGEPGLNASVLADDLNEPPSRLSARVIQPAAAVHHVVLLKHSETRPHGRSMREDDDSPAFVSRALFHGILEPFELLRVDVDLVGGVLGISELDRAQTDEESLMSKEPLEVWRGLVESLQESLHIRLIRRELIDSLQIMITGDDFIWNVKAFQVIGSQLETGRSAREELLGLINTLALSEVSQGYHTRVRRRLLAEDLAEVLSGLDMVFHVSYPGRLGDRAHAEDVGIPGVEVEVPQNNHSEVVLEAHAKGATGPSKSGSGAEAEAGDHAHGGASKQDAHVEVVVAVETPRQLTSPQGQRGSLR